MKIAILGTGAFGIALANLFIKDNEVIMWTKFEDEMELLKSKRENEKLLPGVILDENIEITTDLKEAVENKLIIINALPFVAIQDTVNMLEKLITPDQIICSTTKGIDEKDLLTTTQIIESKLNCRTCAISGPSFAIDIVNENNISLMLGSKDTQVIDIVKKLFEGTNIEIYTTDDIIGIQVAGAVKNAISIGAGILDSLNASESTKAKYLTSGLIEMGIIIKLLGGNESTVYTVAGVGDLILTCTSSESRNYTFGKYIGQGLTKDEALEKMNGRVVEGYEIIKAIYILMKNNNINSKIINTLYDILYDNGTINNITEV